ncbi:FecR domain-containing protein [Marinobacter sp. X15-166B]|uniref:FecR domain-containing protein n=1 Tax=Marinobacter sp. X15-166B TaxID=1897620 RepID=UPI00085BF68B|nr:FecR domain-containing protein [Marinobacter sp. X15-166B]OEY65639.1 hypothetical protein BG841_03665 [Marinobacter sp. X15-166B]
MRLINGLTNSKSCRTFLGLAVLLLACVSMAAEPVRVAQMTGTVQYRGNADQPWQAAEAGMSVAVPVEFQALADGEGTLAQAGSEFELKSGAHIALHAKAPDAGGLVTRVKQWIGTVFYRIERQPDQFSVETPFLVSTVKGTRFVVVSTETSTTVTLTEGALEVRDLATGQTRLLAPGDVAGAGAEQAGLRYFQSGGARLAAQSASQTELLQPIGAHVHTGVDNGLVAVTGAGLGVGVDSDLGAKADLNLGLGDGLGAEVGLGLGGGDGLGVDAGLNVGLGDDLGVDAGLNVGLGDDLGVDAGLSVGLGDDLGADAGLNVGLGDDLGADVGLNAGLGDDLGVDAGLNIGAGTDPDAGVGIDLGVGDGLGVGIGLGLGLGLGSD